VVDLFAEPLAAALVVSTMSERTIIKLFRQTERIQELLPVFALEGNDFSASTPDIRIDVECLPQMINGAGARHRTDVQKDANVRLKNRSKHVEVFNVRMR